ncbi:MAG: dihydrodipicolinate synthase family protein, partial [Variibacter sp.]|nr:dihydrodipicolinate synthase family protein [Variibacter sp.]
ISHNLRYCIDDLKIDGHYCLGNVGEFWSMTNEERMRVHELNVEAAAGRIPLIAGCHHQNPSEAVKLAEHARAVGIDFAIILTPYMGAKDDDAVFEFYRYIAERTDIGIVLFNIPSVYYPIGERLARRLMTIPNICGFKQANPSPAATAVLREAIGEQVVISVADESPWLQNLTVGEDQWLLNYTPHLYQVPGYLPINDYTNAALAGDMNKAVEIARTLNPIRAVLARWVNGYGRPSGRLPVHEQKVWMEYLGMVGGPVRAPATPMSEEAKRTLHDELAATGILAKAKAAKPALRMAS